MTTLTEKTLFSIYGVSIEHPKDWKIFFNPKRTFDYTTGFFRIEDYIPKKGAQVSLSINYARRTAATTKDASRCLLPLQAGRWCPCRCGARCRDALRR